MTVTQPIEDYITSKIQRRPIDTLGYLLAVGDTTCNNIPSLWKGYLFFQYIRCFIIFITLVLTYMMSRYCYLSPNKSYTETNANPIVRELKY